MLVNTVIEDRICYVEMQNADHYNCLSEEMCYELIDALKYGYEQECVGIVIKAQIKKGVWSAGHDIRELPLDGSDPLAFDVPMPTQKVGDFDTELVQEFFLGLTRAAGMTLHIKRISGVNSHHIIEAVFKAFGRALAMATSLDQDHLNEIPSTKGVL